MYNADLSNVYVNDTITFYFEVYDNEGNVQPYDLSAMKWVVVPSDAGTFSDISGGITHFTALKACNIYDFKIIWQFKVLEGKINFNIKE